MGNSRNWIKVEIIRKDDTDEIIKQQSRLTLNVIHKSYNNCDSYTLRQNEVRMDKRIFLGFSGLELSKLFMYETYFDKLQPIFGQENLKLPYMDCDSFVLSIETQITNND